MLFALRRLSLGLFLAAAASAILLASDWSHRRPRAGRAPRLALFQMTSRQILDDGVRGVLEGLSQQGFREGAGLEVRRFNAENDLATANAIASAIATGLQSGRPSRLYPRLAFGFNSAAPSTYVLVRS